MGCAHDKLPEQRSFGDTVNFLVTNKFPRVLEKGIELFAHLPRTGVYNHVEPEPISFGEAINRTTTRQYTISGAGSLIDFETYGRELKRPTPQVHGTGCNGNSLCAQSQCFHFTEGVIENNNLLRSLCWSLEMGCLKDYQYSDQKFAEKLKRNFAMFFEQPKVVLEAYQRTRLLKEAIKVVATNTNINWTGDFVAEGLSLPFYVNPNDPTAFPLMSDITTAGGGIGGINMDAFHDFLAAPLFSDSFKGGMNALTKYCLRQDYSTIMAQTASAKEKPSYDSLMCLMAGKQSRDMMEGYMGSPRFDELFPTFGEDASGQILPITAEMLMPATIAGRVQTVNPAHAVQEIRGILLVPNNWKFTLVEPDNDDFSYLGLGPAMNYKTNSPFSHAILSSSMFSRNELARDGVFRVGDTLDSASGRIYTGATGLRARHSRIKEAVRTELVPTYTPISCNNAIDGQLPNTGYPMYPQSRADGFMLRSEMFIGTHVKGNSRPVLILFNNDTPRSAVPIVVCNTNTVEVTTTEGFGITNCCPGGQTFLSLTFNKDMTEEFAENDTAIYRTGDSPITFQVVVSGVSGNVVTVSAADGETLLPCCKNDGYDTRGELINTTSITNASSEIKAVEYNTVTSALDIELYFPVTDSLLGATGTITLVDGSTILVQTTANASGVFVSLEVQAGETCDLSAITCNCLNKAVFTLD